MLRRVRKVQGRRGRRSENCCLSSWQYFTCPVTSFWFSYVVGQSHNQNLQLSCRRQAHADVNPNDKACVASRIHHLSRSAKNKNHRFLRRLVLSNPSPPPNETRSNATSSLHSSRLFDLQSIDLLLLYSVLISDRVRRLQMRHWVLFDNHHI